MNPCFVGFFESLAIDSDPWDVPLIEHPIDNVCIARGKTPNGSGAPVRWTFEVVAEFVLWREEPLAGEFDVVSKGNERAFEFWLEARIPTRLVRIDDSRGSFSYEGEADLLVKPYESAHGSAAQLVIRQHALPAA